LPIYTDVEVIKVLYFVGLLHYIRESYCRWMSVISDCCLLECSSHPSWKVVLRRHALVRWNVSLVYGCLVYNCQYIWKFLRDTLSIRAGLVVFMNFKRMHTSFVVTFTLLLAFVVSSS